MLNILDVLEALLGFRPDLPGKVISEVRHRFPPGDPGRIICGTSR